MRSFGLCFAIALIGGSAIAWTPPAPECREHRDTERRVLLRQSDRANREHGRRTVRPSPPEGFIKLVNRVYAGVGEGMEIVERTVVLVSLGSKHGVRPGHFFSVPGKAILRAKRIGEDRTECRVIHCSAGFEAGDRVVAELP